VLWPQTCYTVEMARDAGAPLCVTSTRVDYDRLRITVTGEIDLSTSPRLLEELMTGLSLPGCRDIVLDLSGVSFLDASAIGVLMRAHTACRRAGGRLTVFGARGIVAEVLHMTGVAGSLVLALLPHRLTGSAPRSNNGRHA